MNLFGFRKNKTLFENINNFFLLRIIFTIRHILYKHFEIPTTKTYDEV